MLRLIILLISLVSLTACDISVAPYTFGQSPEQIAEFADRSEVTNPDAVNAVRSVQDAIENGDREFVRSLARPNIHAALTDALFDDFDSVFVDQTPSRVNMISFRLNTLTRNSDTTTTSLLAEWIYEYADQQPASLSVQVESTNGDPYRLTALNARRWDPALWSPPARLTISHWSALILAIASPVALIIGLSIAVTTPRLANRLGWIALCFLSIPTYQFGWSSGTWTVLAPAINDGRIQLLQLFVTGTQISKGGAYQSWVIASAVPIGALWITYKRLTGNLKRKDEEFRRL